MTEVEYSTQDFFDEIAKQEKEEQEMEDSNESPPSDIVAYNELRSGADFFRMYEEKDLVIKPDFQRDVVWNSNDQTRFIDSLIKQLPIPSMCFAYDAKHNEWIVIDGLQRISTIIRFLGCEDWKLSKLMDVDEILHNQKPITFKNANPRTELRKVFQKVQNQTIPVNVLRCDFTKKSHNEYLFTIFHRLNSGGIKLNNQEIRNCIYSGTFNQMLRDLDLNPDWRLINNLKEKENYRFAKQEAILRFFAFHYTRDQYNGSISKFLNNYMADYRHAEQSCIDRHTSLFNRVVSVLSTKILTERPVSRFPNTIIETTMIGIASNLEHLEEAPEAHCKSLFSKLRSHESISQANLAEGLSKKEKVASRLNASIDIFSE
ncbi:DUF262 domain-containing protein [Microvirga sp. W0021]|uniref:DUF262 domain-containing protein n=1 Tax=Hohaiivirga grylli TaxID=3133970 RepID=A0ABV0BJV7_9HYPH